MRTEDLLERCLQALRSGQEIPPEVARYLARHPEQRAEVEDLLFIAQRVSHLPSAELSSQARKAMGARLADQLGFDPKTLSRQVGAQPDTGQASDLYEQQHRRKKPLLSVGRLSLARLRYEPPVRPRDPVEEARIREVFRDLTPEDVRRYIGIQGERYLYYRQRLPGWKPVLAFIAAVLRGFKRIEQLVAAGVKG